MNFLEDACECVAILSLIYEPFIAKFCIVSTAVVSLTQLTPQCNFIWYSAHCGLSNHIIYFIHKFCFYRLRHERQRLRRFGTEIYVRLVQASVISRVECSLLTARYQTLRNLVVSCLPSPKFPATNICVQFRKLFHRCARVSCDRSLLIRRLTTYTQAVLTFSTNSWTT